MEMQKINIDEVLEEQEKIKKTFAKSDENKKRKRVEATNQVSLYLNESELNFLDKVCKEDFISRNSLIRKLISMERERREK
jgi:hypothetical protein